MIGRAALSFCLSIPLVLLAVAKSSSAQARLEIVHDFSREPPRQPTSAPVEGRDGSLYGTAYRGGDFGKGALYRLRPELDGSWSFETLHSFQRPGGESPFASLVLGPDGNFYGVTPYGGTFYGTIFTMTPDGALTTLHSFTSSEGGQPTGPLVEGSDGNFYGTTMRGGVGDRGTVFRISPSGSFEIVAGSLDSIPAWPSGGLVEAQSGVFLGTSLYARNTAGAGTVFEVRPGTAVTLLHEFSGRNGLHPTAGLVRTSDGNFYGTTYLGGDPLGTGRGTVFRITPSGTLETLHVFRDASVGTLPFASLLEASDGNLYGTTAADGGAVFRITTAGEVTFLHSFRSSGDALPVSGLMEASDGFLYGTTYFGSEGEERDHRGTVYCIDADGGFETVFQFQEAVRIAFGGVVEGAPGDFYGTGSSSTPGTGLIYKVSDAGAFTRLHTFTPGANEFPRITRARDGSFWGATGDGGALGQGTLFWMSSAGTVEILHHFGGADGARPIPAPIEGEDGNVYGTTFQGGARDRGTVYQWTATGLTTLYSFTGPDGALPEASLVQGDDGNFYGATGAGGAAGEGTLFQITPGGVLTTLHSFSGLDGDGQGPTYPLVQASNGNLYGIARTRFGSVFRITPTGQFTTVHTFQFGGFLGCNPRGLLQARDGHFYIPIGDFLCPVNAVFRVTTGGIATTVYELTEGSLRSPLTEGSGGALYGTLGTGFLGGGPDAVFRLVLE